MRAALLRAAYRVAHRVLEVYWWVVRPTKRGVVCVLTRGEEVLLVRHTYGRRWEWDANNMASSFREGVGKQAGLRSRPAFAILWFY